MGLLRAGEVERERVALCSCVSCGAPSARVCAGGGGGEREVCCVRPRVGGGGPSASGGVLRSTAAPENPVRRGPRGLCLCPYLCLCRRWAGCLLGVCVRS